MRLHAELGLFCLLITWGVRVCVCGGVCVGVCVCLLGLFLLLLSELLNDPKLKCYPIKKLKGRGSQADAYESHGHDNISLTIYSVSVLPVAPIDRRLTCKVYRGYQGC